MPSGQPSSPSSHGRVIFSRSGESADVQSPPDTEAAPPALAVSVTDGMRSAPVFTSYDFTIHLEPATTGLAVELRAAIRNAGPRPLSVLPLQLSSTLHFEHIRLGGKPLRFAVHRIESDGDHTGALTEAAVALPAPLPPGETLRFTIEYSGEIPASTARLDRIGAPALRAAQTDWDRIGESFTGLRGFGDVVWYPVASIPALLGDGARLFQEIGRQKQRNSGATVTMAITVEFAGDPPNIAVLDGHPVAVGEPASLPSAGYPGVERVTLAPTPLGFMMPSLVLASREEAVTNALVSVAARPSNAAAADRYRVAADLLEPLFADWLGTRPTKPLLLLDLPQPGAAATDDGDALLLSMAAEQTPSQLAGSLAEALAHVYFHSPRPWLREGVAGLMGVLWTERTEGRTEALEQLGSGRSPLALAEPAESTQPEDTTGESLLAAQDAVFYRTKATFVLWMLRTLAGDAALSSAFEAYDPAKDTTPGYFQSLLEQAVSTHPPPRPAEPATAAREQVSGQPPVQARTEKQTVSLAWFFRDWVYGDPGLPDLAITNVFSSQTATGSEQWLVAVQLSNAGYAEALVPLTVRSASSSETVQVRVPARGILARRILLLGRPSEVDLNDGSVPEIAAAVHRKVIE